jgi:lipopolysaccharide export system protein LptA
LIWLVEGPNGVPRLPRRGPHPARLFAVTIALAALLACVIAFSAPAKPTMPGTAPSAKPKPAPAAVPAEKPASTKPAEQPADEDKDRVIVESADKLTYDGSRKIYVLEGNIRMRHKKVVLTCDYAEYHDDTDDADCRGHLQLKDAESTITGDTMHIDFTDEIAVIDGHVVIVTQKKKKGEEAAPEPKPAEKPAPKPAPKPAEKPATPPASPPAAAQPEEESGRPHSIAEARERKTTVHCPKIKYRYTDGSRYAWITGPITAEQKERTATAASAEYDGEEATLKLMGSVKVKTKDGDEFTCPTAIVSTDEEWMRAEKVTGIAIRKKKKTEGEQPAPAPTPTPTPPSAPAPTPTPPPAK